MIGGQERLGSEEAIVRGWRIGRRRRQSSNGLLGGFAHRVEVNVKTEESDSHQERENEGSCDDPDEDDIVLVSGGPQEEGG